MQNGTTATGVFSITVGVRFADSKWFRGRDTTRREDATVPDAARAGSSELAARWQGRAWPSATLHAHILAPLPAGTFPGVDDREVWQFLEAHSGG